MELTIVPGEIKMTVVLKVIRATVVVVEFVKYPTYLCLHKVNIFAEFFKSLLENFKGSGSEF